MAYRKARLDGGSIVDAISAMGESRTGAIFAIATATWPLLTKPVPLFNHFRSSHQLPSSVCKTAFTCALLVVRLNDCLRHPHDYNYESRPGNLPAPPSLLRFVSSRGCRRSSHRRWIARQRSVSGLCTRYVRPLLFPFLQSTSD